MNAELKMPPTKWWQFLRRNMFKGWLGALHDSIGKGPFEIIKEIDKEDGSGGMVKMVYIRGPQGQELDFGEQWINRIEP